MARAIPFAAVHDAASLREDLGERAMAGFGGVAEYGITVRWDKNYLKMVRLLLERRAQFSMFGGVRFGGTVTVEDAFAMGFDHVALCAGAGKPTVLDLPNGLARGVRAASDFLMALQLTGAAKKDSIANLQIRLPVVVIGGGLTAIDTATESLAYYPAAGREVPVAPRDRWRGERGEAAVLAAMNAEEREIAFEFIVPCRGHPRRAGERRRARPATPDIAELVNGWGGVTTRLPSPPDRFAVLYLESRRSAEGAGRGHPLRRGTVADGRRDRRQRTCQGAQGVGRAERRAGRGDACRRAPSSWRPARSPTRCWRARMRRTPSSTASTSAPSTRRAIPPRPERVLQARRRARADVSRTPTVASCRSSATCIPSFAGNVVKAMGGAKQGYPVLTRTMDEAAAGWALARRRLLAEANRPVARPGRARRPSDAHHRRGRGRGAAGGATTSSPASSIACRTTRRSSQKRRRHAPHHGGPGADRRLGRQGRRVCCR